MANLVSFGNKRNYDDFKKQIPIKIQPIFDSIREYCFSLGENVVEDIRMHRVVFGKSMTFRWFADVAPQEDSVIIKIQKDRKESHQSLQIEFDQNLDELKNFLKQAYDTIR
jgi:predicted transport protein